MRRPLCMAALALACSVARPAATQSATPAATAAPVTSVSVGTPHSPAPVVRLDAAPIADAVRKLGEDVAGWGGSMGVLVVDLAGGETLASANEHTALNPASNAKLVTASAALRLLGPGYRFLTGLYGKINGDAVDELVLRGQGDPSLSTEDLWSMAHDLYDAGIRRVGSISVDQSHFDERFVPPAFDAQPNEWAPFRAPVAAVSIDSNTVTFVVRATKTGKDAVVRVEPPGFVDVVGAIKTTAKSDPEGVQLTLEPRGERLAAKIGGHVPEGSRVMRVTRRVDDPRLLAGYALRALLKQAGIEAGPEVHLGGERTKTLLVAHRSRSLGELLTALGKDSDNFYAEMIFKALAGERRARPASADAAADVASSYLRDVGASEPGVVVKNGSGLFDANRITPWALVQLLRASWHSSAFGPEYVSHLAIGGVDGTLKGRLRGWADSGAVRAKTGTLESVSTLSGYVLRPNGGPPVAFALLVNGVSGKAAAARTGLDRVVDAIARQLHERRR